MTREATPDLVQPDLVQNEMIRTQYLQARNAILSENICLIFMAVSALTHTDWRTVMLWVGVEVATQIYRTFWIIGPYTRGVPAQNFTEYWARHHAIYQTAIGAVWGATAFLFAHGDSPLSVALTLCGLFVIASGAVPGIAYNPRALYGFVGLIFAFVFVRLMSLGGFEYTVLAVASVAYAGVLILMGSLQTRTIASGIQIRFENKQLLEELTEQTAQAETARAAAEAAQAAAERASLGKSQFLAAASHDLRQPLYALNLLTGSLRTQADNPKTDDLVGRIETNVAALSALFNGLLDISRLDAGVVTTRHETFGISDLFDRLDRYFRPIAMAKDIDLRLCAFGHWICSDPTLVEQMLANLIANAINATERGGVLVTARRRAGQGVLLQVWDTGRGMKAEDLTRIFEEFVQVGNPERDRQHGMGLGLAIAKRTSRLLGAHIDVRSILGRGSVFGFAQPSAPAGVGAVQSERNPFTAPDTLQVVKVLLIEDDRAVGDALGETFVRWGMDFDIASGAEEALALVEGGRRYGVILSDYRLPGALTGVELLAALTSQHEVPPGCCIITGDMDPAIIAAAAQSAVPLMHKPLHPARLRALINQLALPHEADLTPVV